MKKITNMLKYLQHLQDIALYTKNFSCTVKLLSTVDSVVL